MSKFWLLLLALNGIGVLLVLFWRRERERTYPFTLLLSVPVWLLDIVLVGSLV